MNLHGFECWATCILLFNAPQEWSEDPGLSLYYHASQPALDFIVNAHGGSTEELTTYLFTIETAQDCVDGWTHIEIPWEQILRADWEAEAGSPFDPAAVQGIAFGFNTHPDMPNSGELWIDDVQLRGAAAPLEASPTEEIATPPTEVLTEPLADVPKSKAESSSGGLCPGSMALGMIATAGFVVIKKKFKK